MSLDGEVGATLDDNDVAQRYDYERDGPFTSNTTVTEENQIVAIDTSGNTVTATLASEMVEEGNWVTVKDEGGNAGTNAITVDTEGSETVDGGSSASIGSNYGSLMLYSDGANWFVRSTASGGGTL